VSFPTYRFPPPFPYPTLFRSIFPPFWVFTSLRYVPAEPRASVRMTSGFDFSMAATSVRYEEAPSLIGWLMAILPPSLVNAFVARSEEHTSELQSRENLVCRLL